MQVHIAEHACPRGIHLEDVVILRVLVAELIVQHLLIACRVSNGPHSATGSLQTSVHRLSTSSDYVAKVQQSTPSESQQHEAADASCKALLQSRALVWGQGTFTKEKMRFMSTEIFVLQYRLSRCR